MALLSPPEAAASSFARDGVLGAVEVQKAEDSRTWYSGHIVDVAASGKKVSVAFDGGVWPKQDFPISRVRKPPKAAEQEVFTPRVGEEVEMRINATEHAPAAWAVAVVKQVKHTFYIMARGPSCASASDNVDNIVEKDALRPLHSGHCLEQPQLKHDTYKLNLQLQTWAATADGAGCLVHIEEQSGLSHIKVGKDTLKLYGEPKPLELARKLLDVHASHQAKIITFQEKRDKQLRALETIRSRIEGAGYKHTAEIRIKAEFVSRVIGKGGEAVKAVEEKHNVVVRILDEKDPYAEERTIRLFAHSLESLEKARDEVEFVEEALAVDTHLHSWVLGPSGRTITSFKDTAGLARARLDRDGKQLLLAGTRKAVDDAVAMFETHIMYHPVFSQMHEEMEQIITKLEDFGDWDARWEWQSARDGYSSEAYEEEYWYPKPQGKARSSKGNGKSYGRSQAWDQWGEEEEEPQLSSRGKGKSSKGNSSKANANGKAKGRSQDWDWEEEEEEEPQPSARGKGKSSKGNSSKSRANGKANGRSQGWEWEEEEEDEEEEPQPPTRGKGKSSKGSSAKSRSKGKSGQQWEEEEEEDEPEPPARVSKAKPSKEKNAAKGGGSKGSSGQEEQETSSKGGGKKSGKRDAAPKDDDGHAEAEPEEEASGRGRGGRKAKSRGKGHDASASAEADDPPPAPSGSRRSMGKRGPRT